MVSVQFCTRPEQRLNSCKLSADFMGPAVNQSSLALKGGIGIRAMAEIARLVDRNGTVFETAANLYFSAWEKLATSRKRSKHLVLSYEKGSSWMLAYNLYAEQ